AVPMFIVRNRFRWSQHPVMLVGDPVRRASRVAIDSANVCLSLSYSRFGAGNYPTFRKIRKCTLIQLNTDRAPRNRNAGRMLCAARLPRFAALARDRWVLRRMNRTGGFNAQLLVGDTSRRSHSLWCWCDHVDERRGRHGERRETFRG